MDAFACTDTGLPGPRPGVEADDGPIAALDLGTNNCRLLVARPAGDAFQVVDAFSRIVRLGEGVSATGRLSRDARERSLAALKVCAAKLRRRGVQRFRAVATEACRRAVNFQEFRDQVWARTRIDLELISPAEEARLALAGCAPLLNDRLGHALMFDIGGGSTEVLWLKVGPGETTPTIMPVDGISLPFGVINLAERYGGDRMPVACYDAIVDEVACGLGAFEARNQINRRVADGQVQMLGSSGTVTTLAGVFRRLPRYNRALVDGTYLDFDAALTISRELLAMDFAARAAQPCIGRERADLVVSGCAVLEAICRLWPVGRLRIADRGVREGILLDLLHRADPSLVVPGWTVRPVPAA